MVIVKFAAALKDEGFVVLGVSPGLVKTLPGCKHLYFYVTIFFLIFNLACAFAPNAASLIVFRFLGMNSVYPRVLPTAYIDLL